MSNIRQLPGTMTGPRTALHEAMEEVDDESTVFVVLIKGDDCHVISSGFQTSELCWAAMVLQSHASDYASGRCDGEQIPTSDPA